MLVINKQYVNNNKMAYIKIEIITNEIKDKVEILTHDLLKTYSLKDYENEKNIYIDLPCPLEEFRVTVGVTCLVFKLTDKFEIKIIKCMRCERISLKRKCMCYSGAERLIMKVNYFDDVDFSPCTPDLLDSLLKIIHLVYIAATEKEFRKSEVKEIPWDKQSSELINEALSKARDYPLPCMKNATWVIKKEFRRQMNFKITKESFIGLANRIKAGLKNIKTGLKNIKTKMVGFVKSTFTCYKRNKSTNKKVLTRSTSQEIVPDVISDYMLFIYQYIDLILDYSNSDIKDMICYILGLSDERLTPTNKADESFKKEIYEKSGRTLRKDLKESFTGLINSKDVKPTNSDSLDPQDLKFLARNLKKILLINFIKSFYKEINTKSNKKTEKLLKDKQDILCKVEGASVSSYGTDTKIQIDGECFFSGHKLTGFYPRKSYVYKSKTLPLELAFESEEGVVKRYLYKEKVDLNIDTYFNSLTECIYEILGFSHKLYKVLPLSKSSGIIEITTSRTISDFESVEELKHALYHREEDFLQLTVLEDNCGFTKSKMGNFIKSLALSILMCYLFEIRDRSSDNVLIDNKGIIFHIDYEFSLGNISRYLTPKVEIPCLISKLMESDSLMYAKVMYLISKYFNIIRDDYQKVLILSKVLSKKSPTPPINQTNFENIFLSKLFLMTDKKDAEEKMLRIVKKSVGSYKAILQDMITQFNKDIR